MKLFLISQTVNDGYDTYDSAVVCAESEDDAKSISPNGGNPTDEIDRWGNVTWCKISDVECEYIGEAKEGFERGVVCASFNSGV